ncbi:ea0a7662-49f3-4356-8e4e-97fd10a4f0af [Thermothielavioides terrestris]|uniref:Ea0a7662-49f3-4356-8e4e-97fd10a4f0af n=1 Tax=Thermothielavioides terrestris TaxID=2587410 RepID=A0A446B7T4_9PEZI|nr:ea0a7662-49f3-4356-8e4e-97fd10a4f0af [Thermothielavioides terrestris]
MKLSAISVGLLALLTPLTAAWTKEGKYREIFRVRDELIAHEGPDVTFYDFLGVSRSASLDDINKAYKKKSRQLHPDKVRQQLTAERIKAQKEQAKQKKGKPGAHVVKPPTAAELKAAVKRASERQARLSIVADVLRGPGRDRYDYFLANGFPTWKGTEYYYSRYRPGLGTALLGVFLFAGGAAHYLALYMSWKRQREFVERYIKFARHAAWGENLGINVLGLDEQPAAAPPPQDDEGRAMPMNRKMRRMQEREAKKEAQGGGRKARRGRGSPSASGSATPQPPPAPRSGPTGTKKRVVAENGKVLVVDSLGDVYLEQTDEDGNVAEYLLDPDELPPPTFKDTAVVRLPMWVYRLTVGRLFSKRTEAGTEEEGEEATEVEVLDNDDAESEPGKPTPSSGSAEDFELLEKSVDEQGLAKTSGSQKQGGKAGKRKNKKR